MPHHFGSYLQSGSYSSGVILVPQLLAIGLAIEDLTLIWSASEAADWETSSPGYRFETAFN
jgi:hypothetical protein